VCIDARDQWLISALPARPYLLKCNHHEAMRVLCCPVRTPGQAGQAARRWVDLGIENVVITLGERGAVATARYGTWHVAAPHIGALSPVGSGDAMMAGLILALDGGNPLPAATQYGVALGAANALVLGAGCCDLDAVPALLRDTQVTPLDEHIAS
jgi:fructose-1-phosphate kinase PfkB-like protein